MEQLAEEQARKSNLPPAIEKPKQDTLRALSYRLNLCNMYMLKNLCSVAGITPTLESKYNRHDSKSYIDMKKKHIRQEAQQERLANQRAIIKGLKELDAVKVQFAIDDLEEHLRADRHSF